MITIQRDENEYVEELEAACRDWGILMGTNGRVIPDAVWDRLLTDISDGCIRTISSDGHPRAILEDITENGVWGPIETHNKQRYLWPMLRIARTLYKDYYKIFINVRKEPTKAELMTFVLNHPEVMDEFVRQTPYTIVCWYTDHDSEYGVGLCLKYGIGVHIRYTPT